PEFEAVSPGAREGGELAPVGNGPCAAPAGGAGAICSCASDTMDFFGPFIKGQPLSLGFEAGKDPGNSGPFPHADDGERRALDVETTQQAQDAKRSSPFFIGRLGTRMYLFSGSLPRLEGKGRGEGLTRQE